MIEDLQFTSHLNWIFLKVGPHYMILIVRFGNNLLLDWFTVVQGNHAVMIVCVCECKNQSQLARSQ